MKEILKISTFITLFLLTSVFGYFNIGVGYNYGIINNWTIRLGYEESGVAINADYTIGKLWNILGGIYFSTEVGFEVGPIVYASYDLANFAIMYGPMVGFQNKQLAVQIGYVSDFRTFSNLSDNIFAKLRFYVPDPQGKKMIDKLYIEGQYYKGNFKILVGLLEPYF